MRAAVSSSSSSPGVRRCATSYSIIHKCGRRLGTVIKSAEWADTPTAILIKTYTGKQGEATALFQADCIEIAAQAYFPTWQTFITGTEGGARQPVLPDPQCQQSQP